MGIEDGNLTEGQQEALEAYEAVHGKEGETPDAGLETETPTPGEEEEIDNGLETEIPSEEEGGDEELLLGKFKSQEDLMEAYKNLESKLGKPPEEVIDDPLAETPTPETPAPTEDLDMTLFKAEVFKTGTLSEESVKALEKANVPKAFIDSFIASEASNKASIANEVYNIAGSKEEYSELLAWGKTLDSETQMYYNSQLQSGNSIMIKNAVKALNALRSTSEGFEASEDTPVRITGKKPSVSSKSFKSYSELVKAQSDPRWQTDVNYTNEVIKKASRSDI